MKGISFSKFIFPSPQSEEGPKLKKKEKHGRIGIDHVKFLAE
jgi:hypothetical protein